MNEAVDRLESAIPTTDPAEIYAVTHQALTSAIKVIARATTPAESSATRAVAFSNCTPQPRLPPVSRPASWSTG